MPAAMMNRLAYSRLNGPLLLNNSPAVVCSARTLKEGRVMKFIQMICLAGVAFGAMPTGAALAKPPLRDVAEIENVLFAAAVAFELSEVCDSLKPRRLKALGRAWKLRSQANNLGYSDAEIKAYVDSDSEKARMRAKGEAYITANGAVYGQPETFCVLGRAEIANNSAIGVLLRAK